MTAPEPIAPELVARMVACLRASIARADKEQAKAVVPLPEHPLLTEARAIIALLPEPVDPDLIEARELFIAIEGGVDADGNVVSEVRQGEADSTDEVRHLLAGIKRGRELAASGAQS